MIIFASSGELRPRFQPDQPALCGLFHVCAGRSAFEAGDEGPTELPCRWSGTPRLDRTRGAAAGLMRPTICDTYPLVNHQPTAGDATGLTACRTL